MVDKDTKDYQSGDSGNPFANGWGQVGYEQYKRRQEKTKSATTVKSSPRGVNTSSSSASGDSSLIGGGLVLFLVGSLLYGLFIVITNGIKEAIFWLSINWIWLSLYISSIGFIVLGICQRSYIGGVFTIEPELCFMLGISMLSGSGYIRSQQISITWETWLIPAYAGIAVLILTILYCKNRPEKSYSFRKAFLMEIKFFITAPFIIGIVIAIIFFVSALIIQKLGYDPAFLKSPSIIDFFAFLVYFLYFGLSSVGIRIYDLDNG